ncbi:MAG: hypothetical protein ABI807_12945 [Sporichthyaceae bacterium]
MSALVADRLVVDSTPATSLRRLATIEAKRYARHPLFVLPALLCAGLSIGLHGPEELDYQVIPAFFLGVFGVVVAARLTRSTDSTTPILDAAPVTVTRRTAALCLACAVPFVTAVLIVMLHRVTMLVDPTPASRYGTYGVLDRQVITLLLPIVYAAGGPLLGVAVGRWLRFPGAPLLAMVALIAWSSTFGYLPQSNNSASGLVRFLHAFTPYTAFAFSDGDNIHPITLVTTMPGAPHWFAVWAIALCGLAVCAALWKGAGDVVRGRLVRTFAVMGAVALVAVSLAAVGGHSVNHETDRSGSTTVSRGD